jgi:hypothetical protein
MKTPHRTITIAIALAIASCLSIVVLRSFAQTPTPPPGPSFDLKITGYQNLISPHNQNGDGWENAILKHHSKGYCVLHKKDPGSTPVPHPASCTISLGSNADDPDKDKPPGANVTQNISCASAQDLKAVVDTFAAP